MSTRTYKADVAIVGGGLAGIACAFELSEYGRTVVLVDRDDPDEFGGLARWSFGGIFLVDSREQRRMRIRDSPELALADWVEAGELGSTDVLARDWARAYVDRCKEDVDLWLRRIGVRFFPVVHWVERGWHRRGNSVPRFHMIWGTGRRLTDVLIHGLDGPIAMKRLRLLFGHRVIGLDVSAGRVTGVHGTRRDDESDFHIEADAVVIASGGYCGNVDWLREHWESDLGSCPPEILNGSHKYANGDLHRVVCNAGGDVTHADRVWYYAAGIQHPQPRHPRHGLSLVPPKSALWLNSRGDRIGPEPLVSGFDTRFLVQSVCSSHRQYSWQVMNWRIACRELAVSGAEYNDAIRDRKIVSFLKSVVLGNESLVRRLAHECEDVVVADSVDELAEKMNEVSGSALVDARNLAHTIRAYDAKVAQGRASDDEQVRRIAQLRRYRGDRARTCNFQRILDERALPLVAIREFILSRKSLGGIRTDLQSRVLQKGSDHDVIRGLYAVGESAGFGGGGIHGKRSLEGTFLGGCIFTGRVAARSISGLE